MIILPNARAIFQPLWGSYLKRAKRAFGNPYVLPYYGSYYAPRYYYGYRSPVAEDASRRRLRAANPPTAPSGPSST
jgi:hypothetical protein